MKAMLLRRIAPIGSRPLELVDLPTPEPGPGEVRIRVRCCCRLPHRSARDRGGLAAREDADHTWASDRRDGRETRSAACGFANRYCPAARPACRRGVASAHLRPLRLLHRRKGESLRRRPVSPATTPTADTPNTPWRRRSSATGCPRSSATSRPRRCCVPASSAIGRCGAAIYRLAAGWRSTDSARRRTWSSRLRFHRGCEVYVATRGENHRELARQMGAVWVGEDAAEMPVKVDSAIMFAPAGELVLPALESLKRGGTLSLAGIYMTPDPANGLRALRLLRARHPFGHLQHAARRPRIVGRGRRHPHPPAHDRLSPCRRQSGLQELKSDRISGTGVLAIGEEMIVRSAMGQRGCPRVQVSNGGISPISASFGGQPEPQHKNCKRIWRGRGEKTSEDQREVRSCSVWRQRKN